MRPVFAFLLILFCLQPDYAQKKARDFKVTTTDKKTIELYKDYLNQGKLVVLKIMFVDCPPCNDIAPYISTLYKKYGSGKNKVEFIELSNKAWDADPAVIGYKLKYDLPCPSVSNDGGSVTAAALYSDNYYGSFYGTPTFIVIKPNGDVNFDPRGVSSSNTSVLLDTAIAQALRSITVTAPPKDTVVTVPPKDTIKTIPPKDTTVKPIPVDTTPKPTVKDTIVLKGKLSSNGNGLGFVKMTLRWNGIDQIFNTDLLGNFLVRIPDTTTIKSAGNLTIDYNQDYLAGVSTIDLVLIQKHIQGVSKFADYKHLIAADVDQSGDVNVLDLLDLRKLILGLYDKLPASPSVQFVYKNPNNLVKTLNAPITYSDLKAFKTLNFDLEVIKIGDVN
jgi:thiol-disulfide isomerase/thioredoxin